jgi:hypothetical protein
VPRAPDSQSHPQERPGHGDPAIRVFAFESADHRTVIPVEVSRTGIFFQVRMNGSDHLWFSLDSGAGTNYIDRGAARKIGLPPGEKAYVQGAGAGKVEVERLQDVSFEMPGLTSHHHQVNIVDLEPVQEGWGRRLDGFFGYDFLIRYLVTIDYASRSLTVADPAIHAYEGPGTGLPIQFNRSVPLVRATIEVAGHPPLEDLFLVDSGSQDFVDHPIIGQSSAGARPVETGVGLGSPVPGLFGKIERFTLAGFEMQDLEGVAGGSGLGSRLIGGGVLSRFKVVFDYPKARMFLESTG